MAPYLEGVGDKSRKRRNSFPIWRGPEPKDRLPAQRPEEERAKSPCKEADDLGMHRKRGAETGATTN